MSEEKVIQWISQFELEDRAFILSELHHVLQQGLYISKERAKEILWEFTQKATSFFGYDSLEIFLRETIFISTQAENKSQTVLISLLDLVLTEKTGFGIAICGTIQQRNYIYLDDIVASGSKYNFEIFSYITKNKLLEGLKNKQIRILSYFFCIHTWGASNARYILKNRFEGENIFLDSKAFPIRSFYTIENNLRDYNQRLNLVYPEKSKNVYDNYLNGLEHANKQTDKTYRKLTQPTKETFFTSKENRLRFEQILLDHGIEILSKVEINSLNVRPLGMTYPSYKTFGTGTLFFTWRNISNTCPIVFWWDNQAHNWKGLFPLFNRGT